MHDIRHGSLVHVALAALLVFAAGCGRANYFAAPPPNQQSGGSPSRTPDPVPAQFQICSKLDFTGVTWPSNMTSTDQEALKLALNISGSYEGNTGWSNLTNNFDGEGVSFGLLNQNLGTGSLQPMLIQMRDNHASVLARVFDSTRLNSLLNMLLTWESSPASQDQRLSLLDAFGGPPQIDSLSRDQVSVNWATATLYTDGGKTFDPLWAADLNTLASTPEYVSIQINAAVNLHNSALTEETKTGVDELRAYLLMFDINVQDGGMYAQDWTDYQTWLASNSGAGDTARLDELLTLRLRHVLTQYQSDVKSRKQTIIDGQGTVHGDYRQLQPEYCYQNLYKYAP